MRTTFLTAMAVAVAVTAVASDASARSRKHAVTVVQEDYSTSGIPLTVNRRSWLDPGTAVSAGSQQAYMSASTQFAKTQDQIIAPDGYGNDVMKGQPYVPGRTVPVVEFSTLPNGAAVVDNTISYQNYYFNPTPPDVPPAFQPSQDLNDFAPLKP